MPGTWEGLYFQWLIRSQKSWERWEWEWEIVFFQLLNIPIPMGMAVPRNGWERDLSAPTAACPL